MKEQKLKEYFENLISAEQFSEDLKNSQEKTSNDVTSVYVDQLKSENEEFEITRPHLIKICDDILCEKLLPIDANTIAFALSFSEYFIWDSETENGEIISNVIFDWDNPEIGFDLTKENFVRWKEYLVSGESSFSKEELKQKIRGVKSKK